MITLKLTVYFDNPFWIGVFEECDKQNLRTSKITFGSEPKDYEIYEFLSQNFYNLKFSPPVKTDKTSNARINPKRMKRQISRQLKEKSVSTKAQQAMQQQKEELKTAKKISKKELKKQYKEEQFLLKQAKKKKRKKDINSYTEFS